VEPARILGVEGGGTKTAWVLVEAVPSGGDTGTEFRILDQGKLPPSNLRLTTPERLREIFAELPKQVDRAGVFLAGCGTRKIADRSCSFAATFGQTLKS
jgi:Predicted N-acetylglucosamine kinase